MDNSVNVFSVLLVALTYARGNNYIKINTKFKFAFILQPVNFFIEIIRSLKVQRRWSNGNKIHWY